MSRNPAENNDVRLPPPFPSVRPLDALRLSTTGVLWQRPEPPKQALDAPTLTMSDSLEKGYSPTAAAAPHKADTEGDILPHYSTDSPTHGVGQHKTVADAVAEEPFMTRLGLSLDSFKPRDYGRGIVELERSMKGRHLHMIAIGGSIGAGFFVGSGSALSTGGPGSLLIDFLIIGIMMFNVVYALGEMAVMYPVSGGFYTYSTRFIDPSWGFAMVSCSSFWVHKHKQPQRIESPRRPRHINTHSRGLVPPNSWRCTKNAPWSPSFPASPSFSFFFFPLFFSFFVFPFFFF